ncbi:MAG TPA: TMEM165/GDT1 family protein [Dissulfurispiraceae bacterium]|nr:TMEM165/GDT1 family protein [Dissulfurispiraceae bacterium]
MVAFFASFAFVVLAEMGDKTQLLAMCFAAQYRWQTVMWGVFWATAANHLGAVLVGNYLTTVFPLNYIQVAAAASFILFGLWTIRGDTLSCETKERRFSPFWTVAIAFFIAEMGDKTQLATVALAAEYNTTVPVWIGTTLGMLVADAIGILFGVVAGRRIPERSIKWAAALIFILFGVYGLYEYLPRHVWTTPVIAVGVALLAASVYIVARLNRARVLLAERSHEPSPGVPDIGARKGSTRHKEETWNG